MFRPLWLPTAIITVLLLTTIGIMVGMSWRNLQRLQPVHKHLAELNQLQQIRLALDEMLEPVLTGKSVIDQQKIHDIENNINEILELNTYLDPSTANLLGESRQALKNINHNPKEQLLTGLTSIRSILATESLAHDRLMSSVRGDTEFEFKVAVSTFIVLPLLAFGIMFLLRHQIFEPLNELTTLMRLLAKQDFKPAVTSSVDPLLKPLFENYNHLVSRLAKLEQQHRARQASLKKQVRTVTHTLLEQQRDLAAAERLVAVGELTAGLAHELRNPLAAMQVALNNLRQEISNEDHNNRLVLVVNELNRVTSLLNGQLNQAKQVPEYTAEININSTVTELTTLASYQIDEKITLLQRIPRDLKCRLPASRLHQALLNLVLNAAQAIGHNLGNIVLSAERKNGKLYFSVSDDGPGFPQAILNNGIQSFFSGRSGGTGLGLVMVQRFARDLGGEIKLSNNQPRGATVTLTLPCEDLNA